MVRLALHLRLPPSVVMTWPYSDVQLMWAFIAKEGTPERRLEIQIAGLRANYANAHRDTKKRAKPFEISEFLPPDPWAPKLDPDSDRYSAIDREIFAALGMR